MRLSGTKTGSINQYNGLGDQLYDIAGERPTLDLNFAGKQSLKDQTTGKSLVTHSRSSNATYVGGDGLIKDSVSNLLVRSEEFNAWGQHQGSTSVTANTSNGLDGTLSADTLNFPAANDRVDNLTTIDGGEEYTFSVYLAGSGSITISLASHQGTYAESSNTVNLTSTLTRYEVSLTTNSDNTGVFPIIGRYLGTGNTATSVTAWGAQLEKSSTAGEYVKTTSTINSAPRFDHDPETGESLGLLVEESRTNLLEYSEALTSWSQTNGGTAVLTANAASDPAGGNTATLVENNGNAGFIGDNISWSLNTTYTISGYLKAGTGDKVSILLYSSGGSSGNWNNETNNVAVTFDLTNGTPETFSGAVAPTSSSMTNAGNGWWRCSITATCTTAHSSGNQYIRNMSGATDGIYAWGFQIEEGSFPTSYIRTNGSTATRAADITQISGNDFGTFNLLEYSEEFDNSYYGSISNRATVTPNVFTSPTGTLTADKIEFTAGDNRFYGLTPISSTVGVTYTGSIYIYSTVSQQLELIIVNGANQITVKVVDVAIGWNRYQVSRTADTSTMYFELATVGDGSLTSSSRPASSGNIYIWGAQLEESSTATPYVKSDVTWASRGSNATYYDKDGVIRKSSYNGITFSEDFSGVGWGAQGGATRTANDGKAPDGTQTANTVNLTATPASAIYFNAGSEFIGNKTLSFYVKKVSGSDTFRLAAYSSADGTTFSSDFTATTEWQRFEYQFTGTANGFVYFHNDSNNSAGTFLVWGAQLETGPYAGPYAKTTSAAASTARTNAYLPDGSGNFVSAGELLLEESRSNLLAYSEDFNNIWNVNLTSVSGSQIASPNNTITASLLTEGSTFSEQNVSYPFGITAGVPYTLSVYAKAKERFRLCIRSNIDGSWKNSCFNLSTGNNEFTASGWGSSKIYPVGNGWYRCSVTITANSTGTGYIAINILESLITSNNAPQYIGDGTSGLYIWGAQVETKIDENGNHLGGPYATSYIPTYGSIATRAADVSTSSSNTFGNSWYEQTEGTLLFDFNRRYTSNYVGYPRYYTLTDGTSDNLIMLYGADGSTQITNYGIKANNVGQTDYVAASANVPRMKISHAFASNSSMLAWNGNLTVEDTSVTLPVVSELKFNTVIDDGQTNEPISRLTYWPTRLSNESLQAITS